MTTIHSIKVAAGNRPQPIVTAMGEWTSAAGDIHTFYDPMVEMAVEIDADHTLHMFCEADQVDQVPAALAQLLAGCQLPQVSYLCAIARMLCARDIGNEDQETSILEELDRLWASMTPSQQGELHRVFAKNAQLRQGVN
jgi:hypothetical protein